MQEQNQINLVQNWTRMIGVGFYTVESETKSKEITKGTVIVLLSRKRLSHQKFIRNGLLLNNLKYNGEACRISYSI
jgi:hypothetical protein